MLDRGAPIPLYEQLGNIIREKIDLGEWKPNEMILSENEISRNFGVSRMTARAVITEFVREGRLYRVPGKGTYVCQLKKACKIDLNDIRCQFDGSFEDAKAKLLTAYRMSAPPAAAEKLELTGGDVFVLEHVGIMRGDTVSFHTTYLPLDRLTGIDKEDFESSSLQSILESRYRVTEMSARNVIELAAASQRHAAVLGIKPAQPVILLKEVSFGQQNIPCRYSEIVFLAERMSIGFEIKF